MNTVPDENGQEYLGLKFLMCPDSFHTLKNQPGLQYDTISLAELEAMLTAPTARSKKNASFFIPSSYVEHDGRNHAAQRAHGSFGALTLDVDTGNVGLEALEDALEDVLGPVLTLIYSSSGATEENRKWRAIVPLSAPIPGSEFAAYQNAFYELLEEHGILADRTLARTAQPVYLPNVPEDKRGADGAPLFYKSVILDGELLDPRDGDLHAGAKAHIAAAAARRDNAAEEGLKDRSSLASAPDYVQYAVANFPLADLLDKFGYEQKSDLYGNPSDDWKSPFSSGFSTRDYGDHFVTLSYTDAEKGIGRAKGTTGEEDKRTKYKYRFGNAFDLIAFFQFGNDTEAAAAAMEELMRQDRAKTMRKVAAGITKLAREKGVPLPPQYILTAKGRVEMNSKNILIALESLPEWRDVFAYDVFGDYPILTKGLPGQRGNPNYAKPVMMGDDAYIRTHHWFQQNGFARISKSAVIDAVDTHCRANEFHPVRHFLEGVRGLDTSGGLLDRWLFDGMGATPATEDQRIYTRAVGRAWLISALARVMKPGCKADAVLVLEGKQGIGKSTALRNLAGDDFFKDTMPTLGTKDANAAVKGYWIIEIGELAGMNKADVETQKAFLSRQYEVFRPAYGRLDAKFPRQCVFAASTNKTEYLRDETGGRRFWPVRCGKVDMAWIKANKDMLWAEALAAYEAGEQWHLTNAVEQIAAGEQNARLLEDAITSDVIRYARKMADRHEGKIFFKELCKNVFNVGTVASVTALDQRRVQGALASMGAVKMGRYKGAEFRDQTYWQIGE